MPAIILRSCPLCDLDNSQSPAHAHAPAEWPLKRCAQCRFVYLERAAAYEEMAENFAWEKTSSAETARRTSAEPIKQKVSDGLKSLRRDVFKRRKLGHLLRAYIAPGAVADIGCGSGKGLQQLPDIYTPVGLEISRALAAQAQRRLAQRGGRVLAGDALSGLRSLGAGELSGILMSAFLEHEIQPRALLTEAHRTLQPRGRIIIKVPNFDCWNRTFRGARWCGYRFPDHVNYFTPHSLTRLARETGFRVLRCRPWDRLPTSDNLWMVLEKSAH